MPGTSVPTPGTGARRLPTITAPVSRLSRSFGRTRALDGLTLEVAAGEVHGFLGPNGAGTTTMPRVLLGLLRADAGRVRLLGGDPWRERVALSWTSHRSPMYPTSPAAR
jgi:ABC-type multidrug transport system ATPase subunit